MAEQGAVVVVGVDFEAAGDEAIRAALRTHASSPALQLLFVFALDLNNLPEAFGEEEFDTDEEALEYAAGLLRKRIERIASVEARASARERNDVEARASARSDAERRSPGRVRVLPRAGKPANVLLKVCSEYSAELLIVGTHARRGIDRIMLGSVAESLVREAPCPVLVARPIAGRARALNAAEVTEH